MKIYLDDYEVEIKARFAPYEKKYNKQSTCALLNSITIWLEEAASRYDGMGCGVLAKDCRKDAQGLRVVLAEQGYFTNSEVEELQNCNAI